MIRLVLQHRTSRRYLAASPSAESTGLHEVTEYRNAAHHTDTAAAECARAALGEFADTYAVVPVEMGHA